MKRFTVIFSILLVLSFAGVLAYVSLSPEFEPPGAVIGEGEDPEAPVWKMTMEEALNELEGQGLIDRSNTVLLGASGLCSAAFKINGAEFYWWDLETLDTDSQEYAAYKQLKEEGIIDLYGMGAIIAPLSNGPFALLLTTYEGDADALEKAFRTLGQTSAP